MKGAFRIAAPIAAFFLASTAMAQNAIVSDDAALRAGPGSNYPRVAYVPENARIYIHGCLRGYSWCDITWRSERGWVNASNLRYTWNNRNVIVGEWGPRIGLPLVAFSVQDYWGNHYRNRSWWDQRQNWIDRRAGRDNDRRRDGDWRDNDRRRDGSRDRSERRGDSRDNWRDDRQGDRSDRRQQQGRDDNAGRQSQQRNQGAQQQWRDRSERNANDRGRGRAEQQRGAERSRSENDSSGRGGERRQGASGDRM